MTPEELRARKEANKPAPEGVDVSPEGLKDHPLDAVKFAEEKGVGKDGTIFSVFTPQEKEDLLKLCKKGEFNQKEAAVIKYLCNADSVTLNDLAAVFGAVSARTKGQPTSKQFAFGEFSRILDVMAKRAARNGKKINVDALKSYDPAKERRRKEREAKLAERDLKKKRRGQEAKRKAAMKEFWAELKDLNKVQRDKGLTPTRYDKMMMTAYQGQAAGSRSA